MRLSHYTECIRRWTAGRSASGRIGERTAEDAAELRVGNAGGNYSSTRYSELKQITKENVKHLRPV
jgi:glucose dehydrogenase